MYATNMPYRYVILLVGLLACLPAGQARRTRAMEQPWANRSGRGAVGVPAGLMGAGKGANLRDDGRGRGRTLGLQGPAGTTGGVIDTGTRGRSREGVALGSPSRRTDQWHTHWVVRAGGLTSDTCTGRSEHADRTVGNR